MNDFFKKIDAPGSRMMEIVRSRAISKSVKQPQNDQLSFDFENAITKTFH
jgi:hypothetical protein